MSFVGKWFGFGRNPHYDDGVRAYERGDDEAAVEYFKVCLSSDPETSARERAKNYLAGSLGRLARRQTGEGDVAGAVKSLQEATSLRPSFADLRRQLALAFLAAGERKRALDEIRAALDLNPQYGHALATLAGIELGEGATESALALAQEALKSDPRLPASTLDEVKALVTGGDLMAAASLLIAWEPATSERIEDQMARADTHMKKLRWKQAEQIYREAVERQPRYADLRLRHGQSLLELGELPGAANEFREALELNANLAEGHALLGIALRRQGDEAGSKACFLRAVEIDPDHPIASAELLRLRG